jgi:hypothetical protein
MKFDRNQKFKMAAWSFRMKIPHILLWLDSGNMQKKFFPSNLLYSCYGVEHNQE